MYGIQLDGTPWDKEYHGNAKVSRNQEICRRYEAGETCGQLATVYGVTRERICQILRRNNLIEKKIQRRRLVQESLAEDKAAALAEIAAKKTAAVDLVRKGASWGDAARQTGLTSSIVGYECNKAGVKSRHGRWRDFSEREAKVRALRAEGKTFSEIIRTLRTAGDPARLQWIYNNCPDLIQHQKPQSANSASFSVAPRPPKPPRPDPESIWTDEKVAALKQHWRNGCSAQQISDIFGNPPFTRNAVIGKVNRLRHDRKLFE